MAQTKTSMSSSICDNYCSVEEPDADHEDCVYRCDKTPMLQQGGAIVSASTAHREGDEAPIKLGASTGGPKGLEELVLSAAETGWGKKNFKATDYCYFKCRRYAGSQFKACYNQCQQTVRIHATGEQKKRTEEKAAPSTKVPESGGGIAI